MGTLATSKINDIVKDIVYHDDSSEGEYSYTESVLSNSGAESRITTQVERTQERAKVLALLVLIVGSCASAFFLYIGITNENDIKLNSFERRSTDLTNGLENAMKEYVRSCAWVHESTREWKEHKNPRQRFRELYNYIIDDGLEFFSMQWIPNITNAERPAVEAEAANYFANISLSERGFENLDYAGIYGITPDDGYKGFVPREEQPFYFPIQFDEPLLSFGVVHYDVYSAPWEAPTIELALSTYKPAATPAFKLLGDHVDESFSTVIYHPGVPIEGGQAKDLATMLVHIESLLTRAMKFQSDSLAVYIFDQTSDMAFIGGMSIEVDENHENKELTFFPDNISLEEIQASPRLHKKEIEFASRVWVVHVVPINDAYDTEYTSVIVSACLIFVASLLLAAGMIYNMRRSIQMQRIMQKAAAAEASIVANLFPKTVRDRMIQNADHGAARNGFPDKNDAFRADKVGEVLTSEDIFGSKPIADLHPHTTIMFADLVGFTAWSSVREPTQVFTLLEVIYHAFDKLATSRRVFKVETVGDCYVAVAGLPEPRKDHAVVMARFAHQCIVKSQQLFKSLETILGPDTGDLAFRVGLHSGQVTAGVLRGDKGRFQLFGDTMNTASRIETTGIRNKIHCSQETADLLKGAGHEKWVFPREDEVHLKGKGTVRTFFIRVNQGSVMSGLSATQSVSEEESDELEEKTDRLVQWNVKILCGLLRKIVRRRAASGKSPKNASSNHPMLLSTTSGDRTVLEEVQDIISLPPFDSKAVQNQDDFSHIQLDDAVVNELTILITNIAAMYRENSFHNFEHASHVTMSVIKMMSRIVDPKEVATRKQRDSNSDKNRLEADLHDHTFGITSDPLTQFACAFSALIHDVDHQGVPNNTLVREKSPLAVKYKTKSVAEQNSVDLAWNLLMSPQYGNLRNCICCDEEEFKRFRQLVVNSVMSTDVMDKELGAARKVRWDKAFASNGGNSAAVDSQENVNRKATIVIEHMIQASDVSHTMQHWHVYVRWNEYLFHEMYAAYKAGRLEKDPTIDWYTGELGFFDYYIIPLAKKLKTCGVFGVSSDEFLNYATENRKEWEKKGKKLVEKYLRDYSRRA